MRHGQICVCRKVRKNPAVKGNSTSKAPRHESKMENSGQFSLTRGDGGKKIRKVG